MFRLCLTSSPCFSSALVFVQFPSCVLFHRLCRTTSLPQTPPSLFIPHVYKYLSLCTSNPSECWDSILDTLCLISISTCSFWFVCPSAFCLWLMILFILLRFLPAHWYLRPSDFWFWLLPVFLLRFCFLFLYLESLTTWLLISAWLKTTFSAFSLVCIWFLTENLIGIKYILGKI